MATHIGRTIADSIPDFPASPRPPSGAPNVVVIVLDDLGFGQLGCFGSDIRTPHIDQLAGDGVRFNRFHVTALCSPTRACVLTGRNHHAVGMGFLTDVPIGFPGYTARIPRSAATLPRLLRGAGYSTFAVGKWHLAPRWEQSASGPFDQWPLGLGFERYYGFLNGDTNQFAPELVRDNSFVDPPRTPDEGYHVSEDLADQAAAMILDQQQATPDKPFFLYFATGATHAPHQAPREWIDGYRGQFDKGWEAWRAEIFARQIESGIVPEGTTLPDRPPWVQEWDALDDDRRRLFARMMEVYAGFLSHTDEQIGRLVSVLRALDVLDNTVVLVLSDNGTSAEGGPHGSFNEHRFTHQILDDVDDTVGRMDELGGHKSYPHYAWGWAWAGNTPMRLWKRYTWLGGVRTPLIAHWPAGIEQPGGVRSPFCHAIDLLPTVLDAAGVEAPGVVDGIDQQRIDGASLVPAFTDPEWNSGRATQYFEMLGSRAIFHDHWKATTDHVGHQLDIERELVEGSQRFEDDRWALFDLDRDFAEAHDLAAEHPDVLRDLRERWWAEAGANQVLPLDDSFIGRAIALEPNPYPVASLRRYLPGGHAIAEDLLPPLGRGFRISAEFECRGGASGILFALGDWNNGFAAYLLDGAPVAAVNLFGDLSRVEGPSVDAGTHRLDLEYRRDEAAGHLVLVMDGTAVADTVLEHDLPFRWQIGGAGFRLGTDRGFPVCDDYVPPFDFEGTLIAVTIDSKASAADWEKALVEEFAHE